MPAATAAAEPLELPPGVCAGFRELRVGAGTTMAKAAACVFPSRIAPRQRNSRTMAASPVFLSRFHHRFGGRITELDTGPKV